MYERICHKCGKKMLARYPNKRYCGTDKDKSSCAYAHQKDIARAWRRDNPKETEVPDMTADKNAYTYFNG